MPDMVAHLAHPVKPDAWLLMIPFQLLRKASGCIEQPL